MSKTIDIVLSPTDANSNKSIENFLRQKCNVPKVARVEFRILRKSIDARRKKIKLNC